MKTKTLLILFFYCLIFNVSAAIITVVNGDNLQTKINAATAGDILIVGPGTYTGDITVNKKLTLLGPGYFRSSGGDATLTGGYVDIPFAGEGSYFSGFNVVGDLYTSASNITIIRNRVGNSLNFGFGTWNTTGIKIIQNYLCTNNSPCADNNRVNMGNNAGYTHANYLFKNNIVMTKISFNHSNSSTGVFENNVFDPDSSNFCDNYYNARYNLWGGGIQGISFYNNIFKGKFPNVVSNADGMFGTALNTPLNFKRNIVDVLTNSVVLPPDNLVSTAQLFGGYPVNLTGLNNADGRVILKPLSPAINYGRAAPYGNGDTPIDAGAFGGAQPYILNGIPIGPYIYNMSVPPLAAANSVIPVTIKAKTNN